VGPADSSTLQSYSAGPGCQPRRTTSRFSRDIAYSRSPAASSFSLPSCPGRSARHIWSVPFVVSSTEASVVENLGPTESSD
jgi:hypothetical protein